MDAQQELFTKIKLELEALGYSVYDGMLPPDDTPYPFIYLGEFRQTDNATKTDLIGEVHGTVHAWHNNPKQRGTVSKMLLAVKMVCRSIEYTENHSFILTNAQSNIMPDNSIKTPLLHGIVDVDLKFS